MNFNNFSCLIFVLKCANTHKPKKTKLGKNVLIPPYCILLAPTRRVTLPFHHVVFRDHVKNRNHYISTTTVPMPTKRGRLVTCLEGRLPIQSYGPFIT